VSPKAAGWLERVFHLRVCQTTLATELRAGVATFMVMAYIIFVNPSVLGSVADPAGEPPLPRLIYFFQAME
jgi:xanthine/uracil/vitamin C permease (AzgA family)